MKKILLTILLLAFISGCVEPVQKYEQYRKGTQGIVLSFIESAPPIKLFDTDSFIIGVEAKNVGAETASIDFYLSGYDTNIISMERHKGPIRLLGKADLFNPHEGESNIVTFKQSSTTLGYADTYKPTFMVTACYNYRTIAQAQVCINGNPSFNKGVCTVSDVSLGGGQGGPVGVTKIEVAATPGKTNFKIYVKNFGAGGPCIGSQVNELEEISVESVNVHNKEISCKPLDNGKLRLINGEGVLYCEMSGINLEDVYTTPLIATLSYGYSTVTTKSVEILKAPR